MSRAFAKSFYAGKQWQETRKAYGASKLWLCELCKKPATLVHHKEHLNANNIADPNVTLSFSNLQLLCKECHNMVHGRDIVRKDVMFTKSGDLIKK